MRVRSGFSIMECLVYCSLFCVLCVLIFGWVGASQLHLMRADRKTRFLLDAYGACDILTHDILSAPSNDKLWKKITDREIVWHAHEEDIGWTWREGSLYRTTGVHNDTKWMRATKNIVSNSVSHARFHVHRNKDNQVTHILYDINGILRTVALRNRNIHAQK